MSRKLIVLTPLKNDAWALERFLETTSMFADAIVIADQNSTDGGVEICKRYSKVHLVENPSEKYQEASRQQLLLNEGRKLFGEGQIFLALDTDEILAGNALDSAGWMAFKNAGPGTVLFMEKPDLLGSTKKCLRYPHLYPYGYVDDGCSHSGKLVHSFRVPVHEDTPRLEAGDMKLLHYAFLRPKVQLAKDRMYCMLENLNEAQTFANAMKRRRIYPAKKDFAGQGDLSEVDPAWFERWEKAGIDMHTIEDADYTWQDVECLKMFQKHGCRRFWLDDVWQKDWEQVLEEAKKEGFEDDGSFSIQRPPLGLSPCMALMTGVYHGARKIRQLWKN